MSYPDGDQEFEETTLASARVEKSGWSIERVDGWHFFVEASSPVEPKAGMVARFYGAGIGHPVRGLFLAGREIFYRTEAQDAEKREVDLFGSDAADWLKRWDEGRNVWTIEMGGLGPGYEQCIHVTVAEILRHLLERKYDTATWEDEEAWRRDRDEIEKAGLANERVKKLGISGAQWGAAMNLAAMLYRHGPRHVMSDPRVADRHIQVSRFFAGAQA